MKKILVPVDYTERSRQNAELGVFLSNKMDTGLILLYSVETPQDLGMVPPNSFNVLEDDQFEREKQRATAHFESLVREFEPALENGHKLEFQIKKGRRTSNILWTAREEETFMILYPHESRRIHDKMSGEEIEEIVFSANVPLWLTSEGVEATKVERIAYVTDYQEDSLRVLQELLTFAGLMGASLYVFHIKGENKFQSGLIMEGYKKKAREMKSKVRVTHIQVNGSNLVNSIEHLIRKYGINLLAFMNERENILQRWFFRSHAEQLLEKVHIPKLIFQE